MENGIKKITVFGDSISAGAISGEKPDHLFELIKENAWNLSASALNFEVDNRSIFGSTILKAQRKFTKFFDTTDNYENVDAVVIEFGGNDCDRDWALVCQDPAAENPVRVNKNDFLQILDSMVQKVRQNKITPILMSLPPLVKDFWFEHICKGLDKEKITAFLTSLGKTPEYLWELQKEYSDMIQSYAIKNKIQLIDIRSAFMEKGDYSVLMSPDGIHPNRKGYELMSKVIEKALPLFKREF